MSKLGEAVKNHFSNPSPVYNPETELYESDGMVWRGKYPVNRAAMWAFFDYMTSGGGDWESPVDMFAGGVHLDKRSLVGRYHPDWNSFSNMHKSNLPETSDGGLGSTVYKTQRVGSGVEFTDEPIWFINDDGDMVKEVPPNCGAHYLDDEYVNRAGPKPDSMAEKILGDSEYYWNAEKAYFDVVEPAIDVPYPPEPDYTECPHCVAELLEFLGDRL